MCELRREADFYQVGGLLAQLPPLPPPALLFEVDQIGDAVAVNAKRVSAWVTHLAPNDRQLSIYPVANQDDEWDRFWPPHLESSCAFLTRPVPHANGALSFTVRFDNDSPTCMVGFGKPNAAGPLFDQESVYCHRHLQMHNLDNLQHHVQLAPAYSYCFFGVKIKRGIIHVFPGYGAHSIQAQFDKGESDVGPVSDACSVLTAESTLRLVYHPVHGTLGAIAHGQSFDLTHKFHRGRSFNPLRESDFQNISVTKDLELQPMVVFGNAFERVTSIPDRCAVYWLLRTCLQT
jgi:hypothetical protein